ncbi:DUF4804 domain-containing protein [Candidatus Dependentiae bacterium]|nr:MAG: DUF4804 domain-containing protein [Candidatus Dependentiae bacterium]
MPVCAIIAFLLYKYKNGRQNPPKKPDQVKLSEINKQKNNLDQISPDSKKIVEKKENEEDERTESDYLLGLMNDMNHSDKKINEVDDNKKASNFDSDKQKKADKDISLTLQQTESFTDVPLNKDSSLIDDSVKQLYEKTENTEKDVLLNYYQELVKNEETFFAQDEQKVRPLVADNFNRFKKITEHPPYKEFLKETLSYNTREEIHVRIAKDALTTHAVVPKRLVHAINVFINIKSNEKNCKHFKFFEQFKNKPTEYIKRLLTKRPLSFWNHNVKITEEERCILNKDEFDKFDLFSNLVLNKHGQRKTYLTQKWDFFVEEHMDETTIENFICYDEMLFSAFIMICSQTFLINDGARNNSCSYKPEIPRALYCGIVGCRFERPGIMEWALCIIDPKQNTKENGYGEIENNSSYAAKFLQIWNSFFYKQILPTYEDVLSLYEKNDNTDINYLKLLPVDENQEIITDGTPLFFNVATYKKIMACRIFQFLYQANAHGNAINKNIYIHATGLGTGAWSNIKYSDKDYTFVNEASINNKKKPAEINAIVLERFQIDCYIKFLIENYQTINNITDIDFSWWQDDINLKDNFENTKSKYTISQTLYKEDKSFDLTFLNHKILRIHFSKRNPFASLPPESTEKEIVAMYAWDSNSFPGNEYYDGFKCSTADSAAASCSMIAYLGNHHINPKGFNNIIVNKDINV